MATLQPSQALAFREPLRIRMQERMVAALLPLLSLGTAVFMYITGEARVAIFFVALAAVAWVILMSTMGGPVTLAVEPDRVAIYSGIYGRRVTHTCQRAALSAIRVRKALPFSILEFLSTDGSVCLNTTTNWLTVDQLRQLSAALSIPIENLDQADVLSK
jgi:hypothetical protein